MAAESPLGSHAAPTLDSLAVGRDCARGDAADYRAWEESLLALCAAAPVDVAQWRRRGDARCYAGLALMLACASGFDRPRYLALAEALDLAMMSAESFEQWLASSPVKPSRFLPLLRARLRHGTAH